ncbi:holin, Cph1 family [Thermanaeromonas toyohensis ToBE]|uniref:Holin, Cph1 family n=1 Tax=Thermanaeromonas toyohensis ToBE TaxID=698762 RepID=A0A1W1VWH6_9FIRM|nr:phage holin family protein [Thermanaeromonas toyohensis]SMB97722.1 holin, Cph1 family [Thermanaeromonas toyohensis ToBE]
MENIGSYVKWTIATIGGLLTGLLGGWDVALKVLVLFVVLDYITGLTAAWVEKKLNSDVGLKGIAKKILLFVPVAVGYWLDIALGTEVLRSLAIFFYISNEALSCLENVSRAGVPIPKPLKDALEQLKDKVEKGGGDASAASEGD